MIYLDNEQMQKVKLLDKMLKYTSLSDIQKYVEPYEIIDRLKNAHPSDVSGPLMNMYNETMRINTELMSITSNFYNMKSDFTTLIRCLGRGGFDQVSSNEFQSLKSRLGAY